MTTTERPTPQRAVLELQARARDHALADEVDRVERIIARVHARLDGAVVTVVPHALNMSSSDDGGCDPAAGVRADPDP
ncbi:MAG TPA: hypothetical protein VNC60_02350 [Actinomycetota bacterium]|nr:hypothetical protein [Actinomycetota bacterium]